MATNLLGILSHELPDNVFEKGDARPVKQTRKKIIKKKAVAATNGVTVGRKRVADEVCISLSGYHHSFCLSTT